jgi:hypothetical protein
MCTTTVSDFLVGGLLIFTLVRSHPDLSWTNSSITMLVAYLVNTGIITGLFSVAVLIAYCFGVQTAGFIFSEIALPQFYVNCFFSMLNASVYFKTAQSPHSPTITNVLPYFHDRGSENAILSGDEALYPLSISMKLPDVSSSAVNGPTINEVGLPLFKKESKPEPVVRNVPLEVVVQTTQQAVSSDIRHARVVHS